MEQERQDYTLMDKNCIDCGREIDEDDVEFASTMICSYCHQDDNDEDSESFDPQLRENGNKAKEKWLNTLKKTGGNIDDWHCNNCYLTIKECQCGDQMLPTPIQK